MSIQYDLNEAPISFYHTISLPNKHALLRGNIYHTSFTVRILHQILDFFKY